MSTAKDYEALCALAVRKILSCSQKAIKERGRFTLVLSGGATPEGVYSLMAQRPYRDQFDWKNIHFFLGDERWVPAESPRSNYKMIVGSLFTKINIPLSHFHAVNTATPDARTSAALYEKELIRYFSLKAGEFPQFDLILLGLGQDGHTASLFPGQPALEEAKRLAVSVEADGIAEKRITLTLPVIDHARAVFFLVNGPEKALILKKVLEGTGTRTLPAAIAGAGPRVWWLADQTAASLLKNKNETFSKE